MLYSFIFKPRHFTCAALTFVLGGCHWVDLVSQGEEGNQGYRESKEVAISGNGRYVTFISYANDLVPNDTNVWNDVFLRDVQQKITKIVSVDSNGNQANNWSESPDISANGRYVVFNSWADNLVPDDTNNESDIFFHDTLTGGTTRVSIDSSGSQANNESLLPTVSLDGRFVAFGSFATNLVSNDTNDVDDIFVHDRQSGVTKRISVASDGGQANGRSTYADISWTGRYISFLSYASNLVPGDTNGTWDVFVYDQQTGTTSRVNLDSAGNQDTEGRVSTPPSISGNGRYVAFATPGGLVPDDTNERSDVYVHDRNTGKTSRVSLNSNGEQSDSGATSPSISADGRYIAFWASDSTGDTIKFSPDDTNGWVDIYVRDRNTGKTTLVSRGIDGSQSDGSSTEPALSDDGRYISFSSRATNLVANDINLTTDVFIRAVPSIKIDSLTPNTIAIGTTSSVTISGSGFMPDVIPWFNYGRISNIQILNENTITADFFIPSDTPPGTYDMGVNWMGNASGPGNATGVAARCSFCVTLY